MRWIGAEAFENTINLISFVLPNKVRCIDENAFNNSAATYKYEYYLYVDNWLVQTDPDVSIEIDSYCNFKEDTVGIASLALLELTGKVPPLLPDSVIFVCKQGPGCARRSNQTSENGWSSFLCKSSYDEFEGMYIDVPYALIDFEDSSAILSTSLLIDITKDTDFRSASVIAHVRVGVCATEISLPDYIIDPNAFEIEYRVDTETIINIPWTKSQSLELGAPWGFDSPILYSELSVSVTLKYKDGLEDIYTAS